LTIGNIEGTKISIPVHPADRDMTKHFKVGCLFNPFDQDLPGLPREKQCSLAGLIAPT